MDDLRSGGLKLYKDSKLRNFCQYQKSGLKGLNWFFFFRQTDENETNTAIKLEKLRNPLVRSNRTRFLVLNLPAPYTE